VFAVTITNSSTSEAIRFRNRQPSDASSVNLSGELHGIGIPGGNAMARSRSVRFGDFGAVGAGLVVATQVPDLATLSLAVVLGLVTVLSLTGGLAAQRTRRDAALRVLVVLLDFLRNHRRTGDAHRDRTTRTTGRRGRSR
jgi:hypothetical protein